MGCSTCTGRQDRARAARRGPVTGRSGCAHPTCCSRSTKCVGPGMLPPSRPAVGCGVIVLGRKSRVGSTHTERGCANCCRGEALQRPQSVHRRRRRRAPMSRSHWGIRDAHPRWYYRGQSRQSPTGRASRPMAGTAPRSTAAGVPAAGAWASHAGLHASMCACRAAGHLPAAPAARGAKGTHDDPRSARGPRATARCQQHPQRRRLQWAAERAWGAARHARRAGTARHPQACIRRCTGQSEFHSAHACWALLG